MLGKLSIAHRIYALVASVALVAVLITGLGLYSMRTYEAKIDEIQLASKRAVVGERAGGAPASGRLSCVDSSQAVLQCPG